MVSQPILVPFIPSPTLGPLPINPAVTRLNSSPRRPISGHEKSRVWKQLEQEAHLALERLSALAVVAWNKERRSGGRPPRRRWGRDTRGEFWRQARLELGCSGERAGRPGRQGLVPARARFAPHLAPGAAFPWCETLYFYSFPP